MYLVTGGMGYWDEGPMVDVSSTEILVDGATEWIIEWVGHLPMPISRHRGISINNEIFMTGK